MAIVFSDQWFIEVRRRADSNPNRLFLSISPQTRWARYYYTRGYRECKQGKRLIVSLGEEKIKRGTEEYKNGDEDNTRC